MVSVGLSYSSVYVTEENTCTITCTYGYGETTVTGVGVSGSDLTFLSDGVSNNQLNITYTDTQKTGEVYLNFTLDNIPGTLIGKVWIVNIISVSDSETSSVSEGEPYQSGYVIINDDGYGNGIATVYGFHFSLDGSYSKNLVITSNIVGANVNIGSLQLTIKAIREVA